MVPSPLMNKAPIKCVSIMGATAVGKSRLGIRLAREFGGEVISMDSRQVYRGLDIGTGKVTPEECDGIPHHLLDIMDADRPGNAVRHAKLARDTITGIVERGHVPFLVGGTGLYFDALLRPFIDLNIAPETLTRVRVTFENMDTGQLYRQLVKNDPARAGQLSPNDRVRITRALEIHEISGIPMSRHLAAQDDIESGLRPLKIVLTMSRDKLRERIAERTRRMYDNGWVDEVKSVLAAGYPADCPGLKSLGYGEIAAAIEAGTDPLETLQSVIVRTQQYAKRQETYFRRDVENNWLDVGDADDDAAARKLVKNFLSG
jgi:tRNA dimethylallyltransferase